MSWKTHVSNIAKKANRMLGFLRRSLKTTNKGLKEHAYKALVRPILEYSNTIWDPYYDNDIGALEKIQSRAARWVSHRYRRTSHISEIMTSLEWPTLQQRRKTARLEVFFKYNRGQIRVESDHLPRRKETQPTTQTRSYHDAQYEGPWTHMTIQTEGIFPAQCSRVEQPAKGGCCC